MIPATTGRKRYVWRSRAAAAFICWAAAMPAWAGGGVPAPPAVRAALAAQYAREARTYQNRDLKGFLAIKTPDYVTVAINGRVADRAAVVRGRTRAFADRSLVLAAPVYVLGTVVLKGATAIARVHVRYEWRVLNAAGKTHRYTSQETSRDTWVKTVNSWLRKRDEVLQESEQRDGKPCFPNHAPVGVVASATPAEVAGARSAIDAANKRLSAAEIRRDADAWYALTTADNPGKRANGVFLNRAAAEAAWKARHTQIIRCHAGACKIQKIIVGKGVAEVVDDWSFVGISRDSQNPTQRHILRSTVRYWENWRREQGVWKLAYSTPLGWARVQDGKYSDDQHRTAPPASSTAAKPAP